MLRCFCVLLIKTVQNGQRLRWVTTGGQRTKARFHIESSYCLGTEFFHQFVDAQAPGVGQILQGVSSFSVQ